MAIKYLSINSETLDISNIPKLNTTNTFTKPITIRTPELKGDHIYLINDNLDINNAGSTELNTRLWFRDKNMNTVSVVQSNIDNGYINLQMLVENNEHQWQGISVRKNLSTGNIYMQRSMDPGPNDNTTDIPTTRWVRNLLASKGIS